MSRWSSSRRLPSGAHELRHKPRHTNPSTSLYQGHLAGLLLHVYYNEGSHCTCEWCEANLDHLTDPDTGAVITLADHFDALADEEDWP